MVNCYNQRISYLLVVRRQILYSPSTQTLYRLYSGLFIHLTELPSKKLLAELHGIIQIAREKEVEKLVTRPLLNGIFVEEAYRFLNNRWIGKVMSAKKKQTEVSIITEEADKDEKTAPPKIY